MSRWECERSFTIGDVELGSRIQGELENMVNMGNWHHKLCIPPVAEALHSARGPFTTGVTIDKCIVVCLVQPHGGLKEIRFATWLTSMVLADSFRVEYLWSSDSDSFVQPGVIDLTINSISDCMSVGAASVALEVHNRDASLIGRLCASRFRSHIYLHRACPAANGQSTVGTGPSALFRIKALMQVTMPWYRQRILGYKMVSEFLS